MAEERTVTIELSEGVKLAVAVDQSSDDVGAELVADKDIVQSLGAITGSIERVSKEVLDAIKRASPSKATVELGFGIAIEAGQLVALFGKPKGEASIKVTLEWTENASGSH